MKKKIIIIFVLLLLVAGGAGAYYYFFMMNQNEMTVEAPVEPEVAPMLSETPPKEEVKPNLDYFVTSERLNVRAYPDKTSEIRNVFRKGHQIRAIEVKGNWVRVSDYEVHYSGEDVADWVNVSYLSHDKPLITPLDRQKTMLRLIQKSDDLKTYQESFIIGTQELIDSGKCSFEDFELVGGWVKSVVFNIEPVYFVYCGGTSRDDKVYLNVESGEVFKP